LKLRLPDQYQIKLGQKYLELAQKFPRIKWGPFESLRVIRHFQTTGSEDAYARSRAPEGAALEFSHFRLLEVFHLESFPQLYDGLVKLLPGLIDHPMSRNFSSEFDLESRSLRMTSWRSIGYVFRDKKPFLVGFDVHRIIPDLPKEVWFIEVELQKILPSIYVLSFDVYLTGSATDHLTEIQRRHHLPVIRFKRIIPLMKLGNTFHLGGHSESSARDEMEREILTWSDNLRDRVEQCFRPYLSGYFTNEKRGGEARLPAIEVYALTGAPEQKDKFVKWAESARFWLESFGLDHRMDMYSNESLSFSWPRENMFGGSWPNRLVISREPYLKTVKIDRYGNDEKAALIERIKYSLRALTPAVVMNEYLGSFERNLEKLRTVSVTDRKSTKRLKTYLRHSRSIHHESQLLDRLSLEVAQQKVLFDRQLRGLEELLSNFPGEETETLRGTILSSVDARVAFLNSQVSHIRNSFSEFLEITNMTVNYSLQRQVFWLSLIATLATVVGTVAAIISVIVSWGAIKQFFTDVF
jgi:hypothetical protein